MSSEETLARKKKIRAAHRTSATRLMGQAGALIEATPVNADELTLLQTNLSTKLTTLEALNTEIVELTPEGQLEEEIGRADEYSENIQRTLLQIQKACSLQSRPLMTCLHPHLVMTHLRVILPLFIHCQIQTQVLQVEVQLPVAR